MPFPRPHLPALAIVLLALAACSAETAQDVAPSPRAVEEVLPAGEGAAMPFLSSHGDTVYLSWLEPDPTGGHRLQVAVRTPEGPGGTATGGLRWSDARTVAHRDDFFVNWADFPSVRTGPEGGLWAHWLQRGGEGTYDYGVRVVRSEDGGRSWGPPRIPHDDASPTEHGFVTLLPDGEGMGIVWLDGRRFVEGPEGPETREMTLRFRRLAPDSGTSEEILLDGRTCDCCQTDAAMTPGGPLVVYRDRSPEEIRDISVVRRVDGRWSAPVPVARDGWVIPGCPVNGPSVVSRGDTVAVAWFTAADERPLVRLAWSFDGGASFPVVREVAEDGPLGRVDLLLRDEGRVLVSWLEPAGDGRADVRLRLLEPDGALGPAWTVATSGAGRSSGFPRLVEAGSGDDVLVAWTDVDADDVRGLRLSRLEFSEP